jgi:hypothetical protein
MGGLEVRNPWDNFQRLQTLEEETSADRCKALKVRMINSAEISGLHWVRKENVLALV